MFKCLRVTKTDPATLLVINKVQWRPHGCITDRLDVVSENSQFKKINKE